MLLLKSQYPIDPPQIRCFLSWDPYVSACVSVSLSLSVSVSVSVCVSVNVCGGRKGLGGGEAAVVHVYMSFP